MAEGKRIPHVQIPIDITDDHDVDIDIERDLMHEECEDVSSSSSKRPHRLTNQRRKIRKIRNDSQLTEETRQAQAVERERRERSRLTVEEQMLDTAENKQSQSDGLTIIQSSEKTRAQCSSASGPSDDVIIIGDSDDSDSGLSVIGEVPGKKIASSPTVIDCTGVMSMEKHCGTKDSAAQLDLESTQLHLNDQVNVPDEQGRVLVNLFHPPGEPDVFVIDHLVKALKPHQIGGIRFLYSNIIEHLADFNTDGGFGCILAHCMGLGKTLQVIAFIDIFLRCTPCSRVLCVVPINTLQNWQDEFNKWLPRGGGLWTVPVDIPELTAQCPTSRSQQVPMLVSRCLFKVYVLDEKLKDLPSRAEMIGEWYISGGVLVIGYEMYRMLALQVPTMSGVRRLEGKKMTKLKAGKQGDDQFIDLDAEEEQMSKLQAIQSMLCDPGPDLVVCDEGHRIKNVIAGTSQALKKIRTKRRMVLTGYPLQNNLSEYWCMIDFVRPNFLGSHQDFANMFEYPIYNGQCIDSTQRDVRLMRQRAHVLHRLLQGFVQRRGHDILEKVLPAKEEHIMFVRLSPLQKSLYQRYIDSEGQKFGAVNPIKAFSVCCKIWNHVDVLHRTLHTPHSGSKQNVINDLDIEGLAMAPGPSKVSKSISYDWATGIMENHQPGKEDQSSKFIILMEIINASVKAGDRLLVYSQSLVSLNLVEEFLSRRQVPGSQPETKWKKNKSYFRLDGSTSSLERDRLTEAFNSRHNKKVWVFLISTRAGCLGVNLIGANRVVVLDVSWNPCYDAQAVCRIYRYGQSKPCYVYRLVMDGTMERRMYDRQITKRGVADRVIDELQSGRNMTRDEALNLMTLQTDCTEDVNWEEYAEECSDPVLRSVCLNLGHWLTRKPLKRDSLVLEETEERLTKAEKTRAIQDYVKEKRTGQRPVSSLPSLQDVTSGSMGVAKFPVCPSSQHLYKPTQVNKPGIFHALRPASTNGPVDPHQLALKTIQLMQLKDQGLVQTSVSAPSGTVAAQRSLLVNRQNTVMASSMTSISTSTETLGNT